jgi:hypothetical protein
MGTYLCKSTIIPMWVIMCCIGDFPTVFLFFSKEQLRLTPEDVEEEETENLIKDQCAEG